MPALTKPDDFQITTPMGEITVPVEPIKEALNYWANSIDKSDQMDTSISEFFNTDISNLEIKQRDYSGRQYIMWAYSLMEVINEEYETINFDYVITVCDHAQEVCPIFPYDSVKIHQNFPDPAKATGTKSEIMNEFRATRDLIDKFVLKFSKRLANNS